MPRDVPHAWKNTGSEAARALFLYAPARRRSGYDLPVPGKEIGGRAAWRKADKTEPVGGV